MPYGGRYQRTPAQVMAALLPVLPGQETEDCSVMSWGADPARMSADPYAGARDAVITSVAKLTAAGCDPARAYLTFQEYFEKLRSTPPAGASLCRPAGGAGRPAGLEVAAIGGKGLHVRSF